jgi:SAM-dependent methyltransferase
MKAVERLSLNDGSLVRMHGDHIPRYEFAVGYCRGKRVLDAGCGTGYGAFHLATNGARAVEAIDISGDAILEAKEQYQADNLSFKTWDVQELDKLNATYDVVVNFENIEHISQPSRLVSGAASVLAQNGVFICSTPNGEMSRYKPDGTLTNEFHVQEFTKQQFVELLSAEFSSITLFGQWLNFDGQLREIKEWALLEQLCGLYYNPINRVIRKARRVLGLSNTPPPQFVYDTMTADFSILPFREKMFGRKPAVLIAVSSKS